MELNQGKDPFQALQNVLSMARGTWGLCVLFEDYDYVLCARNGSPLIIGRGKDEMFISSDPHAIREHTDQLVALEDGQIAKLDARFSGYAGGRQESEVKDIAFGRGMG